MVRYSGDEGRPTVEQALNEGMVVTTVWAAKQAGLLMRLRLPDGSAQPGADEKLAALGRESNGVVIAIDRDGWGWTFLRERETQRTRGAGEDRDEKSVDN